MQNLTRLATNLPIQALLTALDANPSLWDEITVRQSYPGSAHADTNAIFLRWCAKLDGHSAFNDLIAIDYPANTLLSAHTEPLLNSLNHLVQGQKLGRVMVALLQPGGIITPHVDEGAYADHYERFHISLQSDPGNRFYVELESGCGEYAHMQPGEAWWFNHKRLHCVTNVSNRPRIHLIADIVAPLYRRERE